MLKNKFAQNVLLVVVYLIAAKFGAFLAIPPGIVSPVWPPAGVTVAAFLWLGNHIWPAVVIGECIAYSLLLPHIDISSLISGLVVGSGSSLQAFVASYSLKSIAKTNDPFENSYAAFIFIVFSSILACLINSFIGSYVLVLHGTISFADFPLTMFNWWVGDGMGVLAVGSTIMAWYTWQYNRSKISISRALELFSVLVLLCSISWLIFVKQYPLAYMLIPFPIWTTMRFGKRVGTLTAALISLFTILGAIHGYMGLGGYTPGSQILLLQTFVGIIFITTLILASVMNEREKAYNELEDRVLQRTKDLKEKNTALSETLSSLEKAQEKIVEGERLVSNVINSMPSAMIIMDSDKKIKLWNDEAEREAKTSFANAKGQLVTNLFPFFESELNKISLASELKRHQKVDKIAKKENGDSRYFELLIYPLLGENIEGSTILMQDITERIKMAETFQQQDKLASVGVLTAGIAHEINNPINFITGNIKSLENDINDVVSILKQYFALHEIENPLIELPKIKTKLDELNIDYTLQEIAHLIKGIYEGGQRTSTIVKDLRTFSRLDEADMKKADIQQGIDSTLTLLQHTFKNKIEIIKDYKSIPEIDCYPGKINQVFMNILSNAVHAIKDKGTITIKTEQVGDNIIVSIKDSGHGIKKENLSKIFEPFFTTKDVGKGTGLGLSISYAIISEHKGTIKVLSEVDVGTEFIITLPIKSSVK